MATYFPYSYIIGAAADCNSAIGRHEYFSEWDVCGSDCIRQIARPEISEIYY